jgi:hypothetical protein
MSAQNGDKARFHRERKRKIARREQMRELKKAIALKVAAAAAGK